MDRDVSPLGREPTSELGAHPRGPSPSLEIIEEVAPDRDAEIIDIGGGTSLLTDRLLDEGYENQTVLNMTDGVFQRAEYRLGERAARVHWMQGDVLINDLPEEHYDVWHDAAVFHSLSSADHRQVYAEKLLQALRHGGYAVIATHASEEPQPNQDLAERPRGPETLAQLLGGGFERVKLEPSRHDTGLDAEVELEFNVFRRKRA